MYAYYGGTGKTTRNRSVLFCTESMAEEYLPHDFTEKYVCGSVTSTLEMKKRRGGSLTCAHYEDVNFSSRDIGDIYVCQSTVVVINNIVTSLPNSLSLSLYFSFL